MSDSLDNFSAPVAAWFRETFGEPTAPQAAGWPPIQAGAHTLILAPTGSGKTLAAFLWGIDRIFRELALDGDAARPGVRLLYVSPLKALNNDIERNLRVPLEGIRATAGRLAGRGGVSSGQDVGQALPHLRVAVRTGDTPGAARAQMIKHPPHILITTPESLYLLLTSPRAAHMLRTVRTVIVDEIHTLCGNKRGVHLALTLERLEHLVQSESVAGGRGSANKPDADEEQGAARGPVTPPMPSVQRIGLSATQRPLEEVARFLGGHVWTGEGELRPRPVTIVDTGYRKPLDLKVVTVVDDFNNLPGNTIWPSVVARLLGEIRRHRTTLVFANNRRLAERTADRLNAQLAAEETEEIPPGSLAALAPGGVVRDRGMFAIGAAGPIRAHHGSMSKESRRQMEEDLKAGRLPALIGTSSLELGIDIGTVDLVAQLQSPKSVAQGLQRVGRSGHLVGQTSTGRIFATFREDLVEAAAIARGMVEGDIEPTFTPQNALDVLAQQVLAMVAVEEWDVSALYRLVRQAYPYHALPERAFRSVLDMLAGKYYNAGLDDAPEQTAPEADGADAALAGTPSERLPGVPPAGPALTALRARLSWDRVHDRLAALPGARLLTVSNPGTIPDTGAYAMYLADGQTRVGELDEEFVFETRPGDAFLFGSQVWRVLEISHDRITVTPAPGSVPRMPFWHGDYPWRPYELGQRIGKFRGELARRIAAALAGTSKDQAALEAWLADSYALDANSVRNLIAHIQGQLAAIGVMSSDRTIVAESFQDAVGERRLVLHSPFGGRVNGAWAIALRSALREHLTTEPEITASDDGVLFRFPQLAGPPPLAVIAGLTPAEARERILSELPHAAVFGAQFRMAAGRALLLPRARGHKRTPFWLQRLKAKDLLAIVSHYGDFPLVVETYRTCLQDVLDLAHFEEVLAEIQAGEIQILPVETVAPSPIAAALMLSFMNTYMYEWDLPKAERDLQTLALRREALSDVLAERADLRGLLRAEAVADVSAEGQHRAAGHQARSSEELAVFLQELGDLTADEIAGISMPGAPAAAWLAGLAAAGRVIERPIPTATGAADRWLPVELAAEYRLAFGEPAAADQHAARSRILRRYLRQAGPVTESAIHGRYAFPPAWLAAELARLAETRVIAKGHFTPDTDAGEDEYCDMQVLEQMHRRTLSQLRRAVQPVTRPKYAAFLARWQHLSPGSQLAGAEGLRAIMQQLSGVSLPAAVWESAILPSRLVDFQPAGLAALGGSGGLVWTAAGSDAQHARLRFFFRGEGGLFVAPSAENDLSAPARAVRDFLAEEGASFMADLETALRLPPAALAAALAELTLAGLITNDSLAALRAVLNVPGPGPAADRSAGGELAPRRARPLSSLEADLAARLAGRPRPLTATRYRAAKRQARRLVGGGGPAAARSGPAERTMTPVAADLGAGRWSLVHRSGVLGAIRGAEERAAGQARVLLERYGILTRDCLAYEDGPYEWPLIYAYLQRLEMRGEVRRGYFVAGLAGAQFALPAAVEALRAPGDAPAAEDPAAADSAAALLVMSAVDPANVYGGETAPQALEQSASQAPSPVAARSDLRFSRIASTDVICWRGRLVLVAEDHGARLTVRQDVPPDLSRQAVAAYLARGWATRHLVVTHWNGRPVWGSPGEGILKAAGFYRSPGGMEWWDRA